MNVLLLLLLGFLMQAARSFSVSGPGEPGPAGASLALGYVLLTAFFAGRIFKGLHLPKLTGYLFAGLVVGPYALGLLTERMVEQLAIVNGMAVALIALSAGSEIDLRSMRALLKPLILIGLIANLGGAVMISAAIFAMRPVLPFLSDLSLGAAIAASVVLGVVLSAKSPAVVVALRDELEADGPVSRTVLGVVVAGDLMVILLFAAVSTIAKPLLGGTETQNAGTIAWELVGSLGVGALLGGVLALYLSKVKTGAEMFLLTIAFVTAEVGARVHLDPLLLALAAGLVVRNATPHGGTLRKQIEVSSLPVYLLFFAIAGASIHVDALRVIGIPALLLVCVRAIAFLYGSRVGATLAGAPENVRRWTGFGLLPQAGLALALSLLVARAFPELGEEAAALTLGVIAINELVSPAIYRVALLRAGEAGARVTPESGAEPAPDIVPADSPASS